MKKSIVHWFSLFTVLVSITLVMVSCAPKAKEQSFKEAHDAFQTKLTSQDNDSDEVPAPPKGVFDLVKYPSKVGDLAAYVSSDPGDEQKHPMIIWVVGGWGNGIDEFPWSYAPWDNDQTGSAFWEAGVLTMYPSFRGGNGNPGYYETLFGEVDDIAAAYDYAASLPYVDSSRIYLGGHSTGGTRALLAAEYTDKFRAVFCFGAVDEIKYHNNEQFSFDVNDKEEAVMRSPVHWLKDVKTPTFLIEGVEGNSLNLKNMQKQSKNENIQCYVLEGGDHFSVLAPCTELLAQKILKDTGDKTNITLTEEDLLAAMAQPAKEPMPVMSLYENKDKGFSISYPFGWVIENLSEDGDFTLYMTSQNEEDNIWDMSDMTINVYTETSPTYLQELTQILKEYGYTVKNIKINGVDAVEAVGVEIDDNGNSFSNRVVILKNGNEYSEFSFYIHTDFGNAADPMFQKMIDSIALS